MSRTPLLNKCKANEVKISIPYSYKLNDLKKNAAERKSKFTFAFK